MEGEEVCKEINIKIVDCTNRKPRFILLNPKSFLAFEAYLHNTQGIPPTDAGNMDIVKRTHRGLELLMVLNKRNKFIEVV